MEQQNKPECVPVPSLEDLQDINRQRRLGLSDDELLQYLNIIQNTVRQSNYALHEQQKSSSTREYFKPAEDENNLNAWYVKCTIQQQTDGKLAGKRIAIKDNIAVAGIPMMNGSKLLEGYSPEYDATIVKRILDAGGCVVGKTVCEDLCLTAGSYLTTYGPVRNPINPEHSAGGSSSGSAVAVALDEADMAIGGDQGGSVRIPASSCGLVGLKPTHGLVPYTGAMPVIPCLDHLGPITKTVADAALLLEVIAGYDHGRDSRQGNYNFPVPEYSKLIYPVVKSENPIKIGVLEEGVQLCESNVQEVFNRAVSCLSKSGYFEISHQVLPDHKQARFIYRSMELTGTFEVVFEGAGVCLGSGGFHDTKNVQMFKSSLESQPHNLNIAGKYCVMYGDFVKKHASSLLFAKSSSLAVDLRHAYDDLLTKVDVMILPTLTSTPCKIPHTSDGIEQIMSRAHGVSWNASVFNMTGHPAITLNAGFASDNKLPVGLMVVGKHMDEVTVLNAASIIESTLYL